MVWAMPVDWLKKSKTACRPIMPSKLWHVRAVVSVVAANRSRGRMEVLRKRAAALYQEDRSKTLRKSHENPYIQALYADYLGEPCGPRAHKLLHTHYFDRKEAINMFTQENQEG